MADTDYPSRLILVEFFVQEQRAGDKEERDRLSQELFDAYDQEITSFCAAAVPPIVPSAEARALMAIMAKHAPGGSERTQARNAVEAYLVHRGR